MFNASECVFALNHESRAFCAQTASRERHRWLAGTCSLSAENELSVLEFDEESNSMVLAGLYTHPHQVWDLASCPTDPSLVITTHVSKTGADRGACLYRMPHQSDAEVNFERDNDSDNGNASEGPSHSNTPNAATGAYQNDKLSLEELGRLSESAASASASASTSTSASVFTPGAATGTFYNSVRWHPQESQALVTTDDCVQVFQISDDGAKHTTSLHLGSSSTNNSDFTAQQRKMAAAGKCAAAWDLHSPHSLLAVSGSDIHLLDTRQQQSGSSSNSRSSCTGRGCGYDSNLLSIDSNSNRPNTFVTCGEDRLVRFWDSRKLTHPLKTLAGHSHWASTVRYNTWHDQLLLSAGSDNAVNLWRVASCSSSPWLGGGGGDTSSSKNSHSHEHDNNDSDRNSVHSAVTTTTGNSGDGDSDGEESLSMDPPDVRVAHIDQHTESVYAAVWGSADAWTYASMSYDGKVVVNHVPSSEKYKILL